jgi:Family of unknown function (DUF5684)
MEVDVSTQAAGAGFGAFGIIYLALIVFMIVTMWKIFTKAGKPGWACLIPFYNAFVMLEIAGKPGWWFILLFIPVVNFVIGILAMVGLAQNFGKGGGYVVGMIFLPIIFYPMLAFGSATYQKQAELPAASAA